MYSKKTISTYTCMKLRAFRQYKNDLSDIIGVLAEHEKRGDSISVERIERAVDNLYDSWDGFPDGAHDFITKALSTGDYEKVYALVRKNERDTKEQLIEFQESYPDVLKVENVDSVLRALRARKQRDD